MRFYVFFLLLCIVAFQACTSVLINGSHADSPYGVFCNPGTASSIASFDPQLTQFLASSSEGAVQNFAHSDMGDYVTVVAGRAYTSALGEKCREAVATGANLLPMRFAVCLDWCEGVWRSAPRIFVDVAR